MPTGMRRVDEEIADYATECKTASVYAEHIPLLLSDEKIAWIVGRRIDLDLHHRFDEPIHCRV